MKKLFTILAVAATLASCAKEDVVREAAREAIGFDNAFVENSTRSVVDPSYTNTKLFGNFGVFGTVEGAKLFDNTTVSGSELNGTWSYEGTQYWITGAKYNFAAVAPKTVKVNDVDTPVYTNASFATTSTGENAEKVYTGTTTLSFENNGTTDLLYAEAKATGLVSRNPKVAFTFRHVLSKVKFSFENAYNATNATIRVKNVQIVDAYKNGVATLNAATAWAPTNNNLTLNFGNAAEASEDAEEAFACNTTLESYNELLMIPGAGKTSFTVTNGETTTQKTGYTVNFTVELLVSDAVVATYPHTIHTDFAPVAGNSYDLKATITAKNIDPNNEQEPIQFTVTTIGGWNESDIEVPGYEAPVTPGQN